jgi:diadenosine tetraphosphate (Ap4A) HIT family hydrolase
MCGNEWQADDIGWGLLLHRGEVSQSCLWRSGKVRGYVIVIFTVRHIAESTELSDEEAAAFSRDTLALGLALEQHYDLVKMNYLLLGNAIPHAHWHCVPRREAGTDPAPGGPLPFDVLDLGRQNEERLQADARALRTLLNHPPRSLCCSPPHASPGSSPSVLPCSFSWPVPRPREQPGAPFARSSPPTACKSPSAPPPSTGALAQPAPSPFGPTVPDPAAAGDVRHDRSSGGAREKLYTAGEPMPPTIK